MIEQVPSNPIFKRLTKDINWPRRRIYTRVAVGAPIAVVGAVSFCGFNTDSMYYQQTAIFIGLTVVVILASLMALPAAASAISAAAAYREVHGDEFDLIRLTMLSSREIANALVNSLKFRMIPLRYAATSILVSTFVIPVVGGLLNGGNLNGLPSNVAMTYIISFAFSVWMENQLINTAIIGGILIATRLRNASIAGVSVTAAFIVVMIYLIGPPITLGLAYLGRMSSSPEGLLILVGVGYFLIPTIGNPTMLDGIVGSLERSRLSGG